MLDHRRSRLRVRVAGLFVLVSAGILLARPFLHAASVRTELLVTAVLVALAGLPHGALDLAWAHEHLGPWGGRRWVTRFVAGYTLVAALVAVAWWLSPSLALFGFIALSVAHFGMSDRLGRGTGWLDVVEALTRGLLPLALIAWAHPQEAAQRLALLAPDEAARVVVGQLSALAPAGALGAVILVASYTRQARREPTRIWLALELIALAALCLSVRPLWSFLGYWLGLHSAWVMAVETTDLGLAGPTAPDRRTIVASLRSLARRSAPGVVAVLVLAVIAYALLRLSLPAEVALMRVLFVGLAALTLPHVLLQIVRELQSTAWASDRSSPGQA